MNTDQEVFWRGDFGNDYIERNHDSKIIASGISLFSKILDHTHKVSSIIEFGCNMGINLIALKRLLPDVELTGVEINSSAASIVRERNEATVIESSILDLNLNTTYDLTFSKGVLIHINPDYLGEVYKRLYDYSNKYILVAEYYNPSPVSIDYRGHQDRLFKRDFAGDIMDLYKDLRLIEYGFVYHKDPVFPQDDISWFLMEKVS